MTHTTQSISPLRQSMVHIIQRLQHHLSHISIAHLFEHRPGRLIQVETAYRDDINHFKPHDSLSRH